MFAIPYFTISLTSHIYIYISLGKIELDTQAALTAEIINARDSSPKNMYSREKFEELSMKGMIIIVKGTCRIELID
jgi:hypothetical protein